MVTHLALGRRTAVPGLVALLIVTAFVSVASTSSGAVSGDTGELRTFVPQSATTWWAIVDSNLSARSYVLRTTDRGRHWRNLTSPVRDAGPSAFIDENDAWIEANALHPPRLE